MPNWSHVVLQAKNLTKMDLFSVDEEGNKQFDLNKIIPMPEKIKTMKTKHEEEAIAVYYTDRFTRSGDEYKNRVESFKRAFFSDLSETVERVKKWIYDEDCKFLSESDIDRLYEEGKMLDECRIEFGSYFWYDWSCNNWGTKWNASDTTILDDDTICFYTPWGPPAVALFELSKQHPGIRFFVSWSTENTFCNNFVELIDGKEKNFKSIPWDMEEYV